MRILCAVLLALLVTGPAGAAEPAISSEAKRHVAAGNAFYESGQYEDAVKEFELAYRLSNRPALLFNIARAEAKLGHDENAIAFLKRYLEERPDAPDAPSVMAEIEAREHAIANARAMKKAEAEAAEERKRAEELAHRAAEDERREQARQKEEHRAAEQRTTAAVVAPAPAPAPSPAKLRMRKVGYGLVAGGAVVAVVGVVLGVLAQQAGSTVHDGTGAFTSSLQSSESNGLTYQASGAALDVVGAAAAVSGVAMIGWSFSK
jgi:tetratricopeptide (TPR) repeat protein